jgi:23S rRNA (adenine2503-C2)-methyltransferase
MKILKTIKVPTGQILIVEGQYGKLECLSIGDYGKDVNLNQHKKVEHTKLLPLTEKWVCTISSQYGCSMGCRFCDVPLVGKGVNASLDDLMGQIMTVTETHTEVRTTKRFNIHYARMGEPTWNLTVLNSAILAKQALPYFHVHPVVSTMMPWRNRNLETFIRMWCHIKNDYYEGEAGLQLSINSTDPEERRKMFGGNTLELPDIGLLMERMPFPKGRKYTLNFAIAGYTIDAGFLAGVFNPEHFICKLTPMHKTQTATKLGIKTEGDYTESYPYEQDEENLKKAGFEVLTFIASREEDESRITCGNAILSDKE